MTKYLPIGIVSLHAKHVLSCFAAFFTSLPRALRNLSTQASSQKLFCILRKHLFSNFRLVFGPILYMQYLPPIWHHQKKQSSAQWTFLSDILVKRGYSPFPLCKLKCQCQRPQVCSAFHLSPLSHLDTDTHHPLYTKIICSKRNVSNKLIAEKPHLWFPGYEQQQQIPTAIRKNQLTRIRPATSAQLRGLCS